MAFLCQPSTEFTVRLRYIIFKPRLNELIGSFLTLGRYKLRNFVIQQMVCERLWQAQRKTFAVLAKVFGTTCERLSQG